MPKPPRYYSIKNAEKKPYKHSPYWIQQKTHKVCLGKEYWSGTVFGVTPADVDIEKGNYHYLNCDGNIIEVLLKECLRIYPKCLQKYFHKLFSNEEQEIFPSSESIHENQSCKWKAECHFSLRASHSVLYLMFWFIF